MTIRDALHTLRRSAPVETWRAPALLVGPRRGVAGLGTSGREGGYAHVTTERRMPGFGLISAWIYGAKLVEHSPACPCQRAPDAFTRAG